MSRDILIATINARYHHASLGLRYLYANLGPLQPRAAIREFTLESRSQEIAEILLADQPRIIGLGVYIWNVEESIRLAAMIKSIEPDCLVIAGGPEVGFEDDLPDGIERWCDYIVAGQGDFAFRDLCRQLLDGESPASRFIKSDNPRLDKLQLPYAYYDEADIANRLIYVEASRGCPFKCEFCLSSLDRTAWNFNLDRFLGEMDDLYRRGVRHFKFVDRTFNLKRSTTTRILEYFLDKNDRDLFLHFELIPDRLPEELKQYLIRFAPGTLQFEIGIQTFNREVQTLISRRQDHDKTCENMTWLKANTHAHIHADLIFGLPGEDLESFARGFNTLYALGPDEIQLGILKRLRGTPISRHEDAYQLRFNPSPPYQILSTDRVSFTDVQRVNRFARYWDMVANSGRFAGTMRLFNEADLFAEFMMVTDHIYAATQKTHQIALPRLFERMFDALVHELGRDATQVAKVMSADFERGGFKGAPAFMTTSRQRVTSNNLRSNNGHSARQTRHAQANNQLTHL
ncbi:MAG: B12-binding domain-containing radical SAM protein [marine bacterium B5-7]|nr:MAG: B12-binding domain-containing radical SAM protein [marine bacterium B5-7]